MENGSVDDFFFAEINDRHPRCSVNKSIDNALV